jgi:hypothetical protein
VLSIIGSPIIFGMLGINNQNWMEMVQRAHQHLAEIQQNNFGGQNP